MKTERLKFGLLENKNDKVFFDLGCFDTFEQAEKERKWQKTFRKESELIIIQRIELKN